MWWLWLVIIIYLCGFLLAMGYSVGVMTHMSIIDPDHPENDTKVMCALPVWIAFAWPWLALSGLFKLALGRM